jgi:glycosyltransferase involved in cell wall biosynthesis
MRIEMFMPGLSAGSLGAGVHQDFADEVRRLGHAFRMLTTAAAPSSGARAPVGDTLPLAAGWRALDAVMAPWLRTRSVLSPGAALARHLRAEGDRCDLLHSEVAYPFGVATMFGAARAGWKGPIAITPMGEDILMLPEAGYGFRRYALPSRAVAWALGRAAAIRCISPLHERVIAEIAPATPRRVIPLNVSTDVISAAREDADTRAARRGQARRALETELGCANRPIVLAVGRLHPFKGIDLLIGALRRLPDAVLVIAGPSLVVQPTGDERARLAHLVDNWNLGARVRFLGRVPPKRALQLMAAADVVAVPSRLESLNKVCVEAAAVGTPFVVTETTGIASFARAAGIGVVVPSNDEEALAHGVSETLRGGAPLDGARRAAFVEQFSPSAVAHAVVDFYRAVTGLI